MTPTDAPTDAELARWIADNEACVQPSETQRRLYATVAQRDAALAVVVEAAKECADELAAWCDNYYAATKNHPSELRRYNRDIEPAHKLTALIANIPQSALDLLARLRALENRQAECDAIQAAFQENTAVFERTLARAEAAEARALPVGCSAVCKRCRQESPWDWMKCAGDPCPIRIGRTQPTPTSPEEK